MFLYLTKKLKNEKDLLYYADAFSTKIMVQMLCGVTFFSLVSIYSPGFIVPLLILAVFFWLFYKDVQKARRLKEYKDMGKHIEIKIYTIAFAVYLMTIHESRDEETLKAKITEIFYQLKKNKNKDGLEDALVLARQTYFQLTGVLLPEYRPIFVTQIEKVLDKYYPEYKKDIRNNVYKRIEKNEDAKNQAPTYKTYSKDVKQSLNLLGFSDVGQDISRQDVKRAYYKLSKQYYANLYIESRPDWVIEQKIKEINRAYTICKKHFK